MTYITEIIGAAFGLLMAYSTFLNYKKNGFSKLQFYFWEFIWICMIFTAIFTDPMTRAVESIGFLRPLDLFTVLGFILVILLSFNNYSSLNKIKRSLEDSVRKEALKDLKK